MEYLLLFIFGIFTRFIFSKKQSHFEGKEVFCYSFKMLSKKYILLIHKRMFLEGIGCLLFGLSQSSSYYPDSAWYYIGCLIYFGGCNLTVSAIEVQKNKPN